MGNGARAYQGGGTEMDKESEEIPPVRKPAIQDKMMT